MRQAIAEATYPESYGVYVVYAPDPASDRPLYVGVAATEAIRDRWRKYHLKNRAGGSALRRTLGVHLGLVESKLTRRQGRYYPPNVEQAITDFLDTCEIEFWPAATTEEADDLEVDLRRQLRPILNVATARRRRSG